MVVFDVNPVAVILVRFEVPDTLRDDDAILAALSVERFEIPVTVRDLDTFRVPIFEEAEKRVARLEKPSVFEVVENI